MTKEEVAIFLECSPRQVERYTSAGKLGVKYEKGTTRKVPIYDRQEVEDFKAKLETPNYKPAIAAPEERPSTAIATRGDIALSSLSELVSIQETIERGFEMLAAATGRAPASAVPISDKLMLSLKEASALAGIPRARLLVAIESGKLKASKDAIGRGWRVKRVDLELYVVKL